MTEQHWSDYPVPVEDRTCALCGYEFETVDEAEACENGHLMAEDEMGVFDD